MWVEIYRMEVRMERRQGIVLISGKAGSLEVDNSCLCIATPFRSLFGVSYKVRFLWSR